MDPDGEAAAMQEADDRRGRRRSQATDITGTCEPNDTEPRAAWKIYVELILISKIPAIFGLNVDPTSGSAIAVAPLIFSRELSLGVWLAAERFKPPIEQDRDPSPEVQRVA